MGSYNYFSRTSPREVVIPELRDAGGKNKGGRRSTIPVLCDAEDSQKVIIHKLCNMGDRSSEYKVNATREYNGGSIQTLLSSMDINMLLYPLISILVVILLVFGYAFNTDTSSERKVKFATERVERTYRPSTGETVGEDSTGKT